MITATNPICTVISDALRHDQYRTDNRNHWGRHYIRKIIGIPSFQEAKVKNT